MECSKCGVSGKEKGLLDVLSSKGVVKLCSSCFKGEDMPVLRRPTTFQLKDSEKEEKIYNPGSRQLNPVKKQTENSEVNLKQLVDRNYAERVPEEKKPRPDLVDNFHWVLMRARRAKKITQTQMAKEISESEAAIKMAEKGILPEDDYRLVNKLESFLGVKIVKDNFRRENAESSRKQPARIVKFDPNAIKELTIDDLKRMKEEKESKILGNEIEIEFEEERI